MLKYFGILYEDSLCKQRVGLLKKVLRYEKLKTIILSFIVDISTACFNNSVI